MKLIRRDWNVVARARQGRFEQAKWHLGYFGTVGETQIDDLLVVTVPDVDEILAHMADNDECDGAMFEHFEWIRPVHRKFRFGNDEQFFGKATRAIAKLAPRVADSRFCIRTTAHGTALGRDVWELDGLEDALYNAVLRGLHQRSEHATISRTDCDLLVDVEIVHRTAGLACWSRAQLQAYPFLNFADWEGPTISSIATPRSSSRPRR